MKKFISFALSVIFIFSCSAIPVLGVETNDRSNMDYKMQEVCDILNDYLEEQNISLAVGTQEYYEYLLDQLMYHEDKNLEKHPQYELILDYASLYLCAYQEHMNPIETANRKSNAQTDIVDIGDSFNETIASLSQKYRVDESTIETASVLDAAPKVIFNYNAANAVAYARKWALSKNSKYKSFREDCANFASQCLIAGGVPLVKTSIPVNELTKSSTQWFHYKDSHNGRFYYTNSFVQVGVLANFWVWSKSVPTMTATTRSSAISNVKAGDIVNLKRPSTGAQYHSIIVSYKSGNTAKYCAHTNNRKDESFATISSDNQYFIMKFAKR